MAEETQVQDLVYALAASPDFANDGICFAAHASGLYRSANRGETWDFAYGALNPEAPLATTAVIVSPDFETDRSVFAGVPGGILRSVDGGETWNVALLPSPPPIVSMLIVSPSYAEDGTLFAGMMEDGVFRSADRGGHWYRWNFGLLDLNVFALAISPGFADDETLYVGTESGIFRSTNGGRAWREVSFPIDFAPVLSLAISPGYASDGTLFAGTESCGLYRSDDRGQTWTRLGADVIEDGGAVNDILLSPEFPSSPAVLAMLGTALLVSRDGGQAWVDWKADLPLDEGVSSVGAPQGLALDAPLLVGLLGGDVLRA